MCFSGLLSEIFPFHIIPFLFLSPLCCCCSISSSSPCRLNPPSPCPSKISLSFSNNSPEIVALLFLRKRSSLSSAYDLLFVFLYLPSCWDSPSSRERNLFPFHVIRVRPLFLLSVARYSSLFSIKDISMVFSG